MRLPEHPAAQALLGAVAKLYEGAVRVRNRFYDRPGSTVRADLPVISVGNLTVGGTGKTPVAAWIARRLLREGLKPAVVSRGYRGRAGRGPLVVSAGGGPLCESDRCGDEPHLLARTLTDTVVVVGSDRAAGAEAARRAGAQVVILDDGFQHRRLDRDLDILLLDAGNPFGNHRLLPAGILREPLSALRRADLVLVTRSRPGETFPALERVLRRYNPSAPLLPAGHRRVGFVGPQGEPVTRPGRAAAFCGIAQPAAFRNDLVDEGLELVDFRVYPDHHRYSEAEIRELRALAAQHEAALVTTEKDLSRLGPAAAWVGPPELSALRIEVAVYEPGPLIEALAGLVRRSERT